MPLVAVAAGSMTLAIPQKSPFVMTRSLILRAIIAAIFALPASSAGYQVTLAMAQIGEPSLACHQVFACLGAFFIAGTAWMRMTIFTQPSALEPGRAASGGPRPVFTAATGEG